MSKLYRRSEFLEVLLAIRGEMAREADYDVDLFVEMARSGRRPSQDSEVDEKPPRPTARRRVGELK